MSPHWMLNAAAIVAALPLAAQTGPLLRNGGFTEVRTVAGAPSADQGFGIWTLGPEALLPLHWTLNASFPGELAVVSAGAPPAERSLRLRANGARGEAHLCQPCPELQAGTWYLVQARLRGGSGRLGFYEYSADGRIETPAVAVFRGSATWQSLQAYYQPSGAGFKSASLYLAADAGATLEVAEVGVTLAPFAESGPGSPVVLETDLLRLRLSAAGVLEEFRDRLSGVDYVDAAAPAPLCIARIAGAVVPAIRIEAAGDRLRVRFAEPSVNVVLRVERQPRYLTVTVERVDGKGLEVLQFCDLRLRLTASVGTLLNLVQGESFGACLLACNERTNASSVADPGARLRAEAYAEFGLEGARFALIGAPRDQIPGIIEQVEIEQGLPHPTLDGQWLRQHPGRFASYLMAVGVTEQNIDAVIDFARGGFGCIEILNWWESTPTYEPDRKLFPNGMAGLKTCADKIHAAGLQVGLHFMQGMVGWGGVGMKDPYVSPVADPRLLQDRQTTLAAGLDEQASELPSQDDLSAWPASGDLLIAGEVVRYSGRTAERFTGCSRGLHGTRVSAHAAGTRVGHLVNCFGLWGYCIYAPAVGSSMIDEICDNIARACNATGADMAYFDGGEELACQPPQWRNQGLIALGVMRRLQKPLFLGGNALYTNLSWHAISRGSPSYDPIYYGRDEYSLRFKGPNPAQHARNLLVGDVGWFTPHVHSLATHAVTPDEVMLLCLKALAGNAPLSFIVSADHLFANRRTPEMLAIIRTCDQLKREQYFSEAVRRQLAAPLTRHLLEPGPAGGWQVRPLSVSPRRVLDAARPGAAVCGVANPYAAQAPWLRLRACTRLAAYGAPGNLVLADPAGATPFGVDGSSATDLVPSVSPATERAPDGTACFRYRAANAAAQRSAWCRLTLPFEPPRDLSAHRALGLWVHSQGRGGVLNVQLMNRYDGAREHYVPLDVPGWTFVTLELPEEARYYDYRWPYNFSDVMYRPFAYNEVIGVRLYYNDLPAQSDTECLIGRIEALQEMRLPLVSPVLAVGAATLRFPLSLQPDEYVEMDRAGLCRHFDPNGAVLAEVRPEGALLLPGGSQHVSLSCATNEASSARAELIVSTCGPVLDNAPAAKPLAP